MSADDGYEGPAEIVAGARTIPVSVRLAGHFDAISGCFTWYGRVAADAQVGALLESVESGTRTVTLRTPEGQAETALTDVDPWGRYRVAGSGPPPFAGVTEVPDE